MDPIPPQKSVIPNPRIPRTVGTLNIIFASLLLLCDLGCGVYVSLLVPTIGMAMEGMQKKVQDQQEVEKKAFLADLDEKEKAAKTDEEKLEIKAKRLEVEKRPKAVMPGTMDMKQMGWDDPKLVTYVWVTVMSGMLLNLLLLAAGIGLLQRRSWGLKLGLGVPVAKIVRLVVLCAYCTLVLIPEFSIKLAKTINEAMVQQQAANKAQPPNMYELLARTYTIMYTVMTIGFFLVAVIYPLISVWMLTRPGVKAACSDKVAITEQGEPW
jgi:hypothetical protein